jgi:hypothetical protein
MTATTVYSFQVTIPPGTKTTAPYSQSLTFPVYTVDSIDWRVPPGPLGAMGFQIAQRNQQVIPYAAGTWIVANDESKTWQIDNLPDNGDWSLIGYNLGQWPHSVYVRFHVEPVPAALAPAVAPSVAISTLTSS